MSAREEGESEVQVKKDTQASREELYLSTSKGKQNFGII